MMAATTIQPGFLLQGRYQVIRLLGGGGFGQVFEVEDGGIPKVLKVLDLQRFNNPETRNKVRILFQREAEILSRLQHPGIPRADAYFTWPEGATEPLQCLVMEKIAGKNLQELMSGIGNQPITGDEAYKWLFQLLEILYLLHEHHYFHRDIKPSNIMLKPDGQMVLIDFGAVREVTQTYLRRHQENETGTVIVSAGYTPSEQAEGRAVPQSDFFALGRTFVYLLTGNSPMNFPKNPETGELIWRDKATQISPQLADAIDWLMAPFPGQRPRNCQEILDTLVKIKSNSRLSWLNFIQINPGYSLPNKKSEGKEKPNFRRLWVLYVPVLLFLGGVSFWKLSPEMANYLNNQGVSDYRKGNLEAALFYYRLALILDPKIAQAYQNLGFIYEDRQQLDEARIAYQNSIRNGLSDSYSSLGRLHILKKDYSTALNWLQKGLPLARNKEVKYAMLKNLGWAKLQQGRYREALSDLETAIELDSDRAPAYCLKAQVMERQNNQQAALLAWSNCLKYANLKNPDEKMWIKIAPPTTKS